MAELDAFSVTVIGADVVQQALEGVGLRVRRSAIAKGLRAAANIVKAEAKARVPVRTGKVKKAIATSISTRIGGVGFKGKAEAKVGVARGKGAGYFIPLELGHAMVIRGKVRGNVPARPFLRPALESKRGEAVAVFRAAIKEEVERRVALGKG